MTDEPLVAVWVTAGNREYVKTCLPAFLDRCTYPNIELLISYHGRGDPLGVRRFLEDLPFPRKRIFDTSDTCLSGAYYRLLEASPDWYINIEDDFLFLADPGPMIRDGLRLMGSDPRLCAIRLTAHTPLFLDALNRAFAPAMTEVGPAVYGFSISNTQHLVSCKACRATPDLWQIGTPYRYVDMVGPLLQAGHYGATMLRYWGASIHVGLSPEDREVTDENRHNAREGAVLRKYGMFGPRPERMLYSGALNEEQKAAFVYPLYLAITPPLVPEHVPAAAQERVGPCTATRVC